VNHLLHCLESLRLLSELAGGPGLGAEIAGRLHDQACQEPITVPGVVRPVPLGLVSCVVGARADADRVQRAVQGLRLVQTVDSLRAQGFRGQALWSRVAAEHAEPSTVRVAFYRARGRVEEALDAVSQSAGAPSGYMNICPAPDRIGRLTGPFGRWPEVHQLAVDERDRVLAELDIDAPHDELATAVAWYGPARAILSSHRTEAPAWHRLVELGGTTSSPARRALADYGQWALTVPGTANSIRLVGIPAAIKTVTPRAGLAVALDALAVVSIRELVRDWDVVDEVLAAARLPHKLENALTKDDDPRFTGGPRLSGLGPDSLRVYERLGHRLLDVLGSEHATQQEAA
jgi:hypothetical protein